MAELATDVERYSDPAAFAREVNLPLLGTVALPPVPAEANLSTLLEASTRGDVAAVVEGLAQTRQSLTLRSLLVAGFPHDPECFALGLAVARAWSRLGLKVAVVDLDGWNPTVVRPRGEPSEGFVDVLEYGCSFQRVAWEIVAGSLWLVGPGSHPPDEGRLVEHPDWDRAARVFAARADVTLYVAPFLDRPGTTGRLSKRMDGVILAASVDRIGRADLRDAFLELWGSDAPIIGCVALEGEAPALAATPAPPALAQSSARPAPPASVETPLEIPAAEAADVADPFRPVAAAPSRSAPDDGEGGLLSDLEREVRLGTVVRRRRSRRSSAGFWIGAAAVVAVGVGIAAWIRLLEPGKPLPTNAETTPAGEERVLPAPPEDGGASATPSAGAPATGHDGAAPAPAPPAVAAGLASGASVPLTVGPPENGKPFRVHVASFRSAEKVTPIVEALRLKGADAWYERADDGSGWYRVFVGRFATEDEAAAYASWLLENRWVDRAHAYPSTSR